jgi:hypothetical protein
MTRYYFDIQDDEGVWPDEEGIELPDVEAAEVEAALSLAGMAQSEFLGKVYHRLAVQVRTDEGPLFQAAFIFELKRLQ